MKKILIFPVSMVLLLLQCSCNDPVPGTKETPAEKIKIENNGVNIDYSVTGNGDTTLFFVHGWAINKGYWSNQVDHFQKDYRVVTIDLPGFGNSGKNRTNWSVEEYGKDLSAVITKLDLHNIILIGHSMSGAIIVETALHHPDRILGLIGIDNFKGFGAAETPETKKASADIYKAARTNYKRMAAAFAQYLFSDSTDTLVRKRVMDDILRADTTISVNTLEQGEEYPLAPKLAATKKKVYLVNSDTSPTDSTGFVKNKIGYEVLSIHATGHYPMIEKPADFNRLLEQAIEKIKAGDN